MKLKTYTQLNLKLLYVLFVWNLTKQQNENSIRGKIAPLSHVSNLIVKVVTDPLFGSVAFCLGYTFSRQKHKKVTVKHSSVNISFVSVFIICQRGRRV